MESEDRQKTKLLAPNSYIVNAKEKFLKEIKSTTPGNARMIRKPNSLIANRKEVLVVWIDQISHNILLRQSPTQSKTLTLSHSMETERGEEVAEEKFESSRG